MRKLANTLVSKRVLITAIMLILTVVCAFLATKVEKNTDMTKYLSDSSNMKQGLSLLSSDFPEAPTDSTIRVMFRSLSAEQETEILDTLMQIPYVSTIDYAADGSNYHKDNCTLFVVHTPYAYDSEEELSVEKALSERFSSHDMIYQNNDIQKTKLTLPVLGGALFVLLVILFIMSKSYVEPLLFLLTTAVAVVINLGTNIFLGYTADITSAIGPVLQLVLSMDYSIILMNRYRDERAIQTDKYDAMKHALSSSFSSIVSSSVTTVVGLLALLFMNFKIGHELGIVLAKGVFISMICVFTILPILILLCDSLITKTKKKAPHFKMKGSAAYSHKFRKVIPIFFVVFFVSFFILQNNTEIIFTEGIKDPLASVFPKEQTLVLLYDNEDEAHIDAIVEAVSADTHVQSVTGYTNTIGRQYTATELTYVLAQMGTEMNFSPSLLAMLDPSFVSMINTDTMSIPQFLSALSQVLTSDPRFAQMADADTLTLLSESAASMEEAVAQLKGTRYSRLIITTDYPEESEESTAFMNQLDSLRDEHLSKESYLIGTLAMVHEMEQSFDKEFLLVTIITALAIFVVVLLTFRSVIIPALLVLLVQCGVYITVTVIGWQGYEVYYLALLIVQSILMGATIDYAIVYTNYYRESRRSLSVRDALGFAYEHSIHTILTSGLILILVTAILGKFVSTQTISQVCSTISIGSLSAVLLILFILPGTLAFCDRFVVSKKDNKRT